MKQDKGQQGFAKRMHWSEQAPASNNTRDNSTHGHYQVVSTEIRLIMFFAVKNREALYSQQETRLETDCGSDHKLLNGKIQT